MKKARPRPQDYALLPSKASPLTKTVTVIVCARNDSTGAGQAKLDLVLASLTAQDYPADLLRTVIVDDGSPVPVSLPPTCPDATLLVRLEDSGALWGKSRAANVGASHASSDLLFFLDSDMVLDRSHVSQLVSWCARSENVVAFGYKRICTDVPFTPDEVLKLVRAGRHSELSAGPTRKHAWLEDYVDSTAALRSAGPDVFRAVTGSTLMLSAGMWRSSGGYDQDMVTAEDTELGYRLCQRGAIVVPVPAAQAWHVGDTTMERHRDTMLEHNRNLLAPRVPLLGHLRTPTTSWQVPTVVADVFADSETANATAGLVDALLAGKLGVDVRIRVICSGPDGSRYNPTSDEHSSVRSLMRRFHDEARVEFNAEPVADPFPSPFYVAIPGNIPLSGLRRMLDILRDRQVGVVATALPENYPYPCVVWRTAALARAGLAGRCAAARGLRISHLVTQVGQSWGFWWVDPPSVGIHPGKPTYQSDPVLSRPGGGPAVSYLRSAWSAWSSVSFSASGAAAIGAGLARGASRRGRRKAKAQLQRLVTKL